jgi:hypothetical protein
MDDRETHRKEEVEHPKGALLLILVYLLSLILLWTHTYLRLWIKEGGLAHTRDNHLSLRASLDPSQRRHSSRHASGADGDRFRSWDPCARGRWTR